MRCTNIFLLLCIVFAFAREQVVLDAAADDPNKLTPGDKYPMGKGWMEVKEFGDDAVVLPKPQPAEIPLPKKEEYVDPTYRDEEFPDMNYKGGGYGEGPVVEVVEATPDVISYDGIKEAEEAKKAEAEAAAQEAAAQQSAADEEATKDPYQYPEIRDVPEGLTGRIDFDPNAATGPDKHILELALKNTVVPEYNIPHPPLKAKIPRDQYDAEIEAERQKAIMADEAVDARIQESRNKLYSDWAEKIMKEQLAKEEAERANSDDDKYLTPVIVDKHGHPVEDIREFYTPYPGAPDVPQAFPQAPDYVPPADNQHAYFNKLIMENKYEGFTPFQQQQLADEAAAEGADGQTSEALHEEKEAQIAAQQAEQMSEESPQQLEGQQIPHQQQIRQQQQLEEQNAEQQNSEQSVEEPQLPQEEIKQQQMGQQQMSQQQNAGEEEGLPQEEDGMTEESATQAILDLKNEVMALSERVTAIEEKENGEVPTQEEPGQQQAASQQQTAAQQTEQSEEAAAENAEAAEAETQPLPDTETIHEEQKEAAEEANAEAVEQTEQADNAAADEVTAEAPVVPEDKVDTDAETVPEEIAHQEIEAKEEAAEEGGEQPVDQQAVQQEPIEGQQEPAVEEANTDEATVVDAETSLAAVKEAEKFLEKLIALKKSVARRRF